MAYVIAEPCINTKDTACVDVCPVDCIHPRKDEAAYQSRNDVVHQSHRMHRLRRLRAGVPRHRHLRARRSAGEVAAIYGHKRRVVRKEVVLHMRRAAWRIDLSALRHRSGRAFFASNVRYRQPAGFLPSASDIQRCDNLFGLYWSSLCAYSAFSPHYLIALAVCRLSSVQTFSAATATPAVRTRRQLRRDAAGR